MATRVMTKRIDADTHFSLTIDHRELRDMVPRSGGVLLEEMMYRDALQIVDLDVVKAAIAGREPSLDGHVGDPTWDPEARLAEMDRLGFDMQVLNTQRAMPNLLMPPDSPLWLRVALARLYNNAAAELQSRYPDRFICQITVPWDDIQESVRELERAAAMGLRAVTICGSYLEGNLDAYELYPFWEAVSTSTSPAWSTTSRRGTAGTSTTIALRTRWSAPSATTACTSGRTSGSVWTTRSRVQH